MKSEVEARRFTVGSRETYGMRVVYTYRVKKQNLRSDAISSEGPVFTSSRQRAEREAARFPVGAAVNVRYDPADPRRAYLVGGSSLLGIGIQLAGALAMAGGAALIWWNV